MKRIMIVGGPGSGKSTLARWLAVQTGLPVQHMDHIHWLPNWIERSTEQKVPLIAAIEAQDRWIIEGAVSSRYSARLARADIMIWLDLPIHLRLWRVLYRSWRYRGRTRPDMPKGCPEQFGRETLSFLRWMWRNRIGSRDKILKCIAQYDGRADIHHLTTPRAVAKFQEFFIIP